MSVRTNKTNEQGRGWRNRWESHLRLGNTRTSRRREEAREQSRNKAKNVRRKLIWAPSTIEDWDRESFEMGWQAERETPEGLNKDRTQSPAAQALDLQRASRMARLRPKPTALRTPLAAAVAARVIAVGRHSFRRQRWQRGQIGARILPAEAIFHATTIAASNYVQEEINKQTNKFTPPFLCFLSIFCFRISFLAKPSRFSFSSPISADISLCSLWGKY